LLVVHPSEDEAGRIPAVLLLNLLAKVVQALVIAHRELPLEVLIVLVNVVAHQVAVYLDVVDAHDGHGNHRERIKCDADALTDRASEFRAELARKQVLNEALIPEDVLVPGLVASDLI